MTNTLEKPNLDKIKGSYNKAKKQFYAIEKRYKDDERIIGMDAYKYSYLADKMRRLNNEHFFASHGTWLSNKESW